MTLFQKTSHILLYALMFITPLLLFPETSEAFEFVKLNFVYTITILAVAVWIGQSVASKRIIFRRTALDIPLILYILTILISTRLSIDPLSSVFGTYGRFNGGLLSQLSYALLYWIFVSLVPQTVIRKSFKLLLISAFIVSLIAIIEHFGVSLTCYVMTSGEGKFLSYFHSVDTACWTQDFQSRVFSTLGQPNWLAAWLVALSPLAWYLWLKQKNKKLLLFSLLYAIAIVFTKSRSGYLGLAVAGIAFLYFKFGKFSKKHRFWIAALSIIGIIIAGYFSTQLSSSNTSPNDTIVITDSSVIRKHIWKSAFSIWNDYKIFGSGPETFFLTFPRYKSEEFNMTSEWDFIFNKSHNQFLDLLANTGLLTLLAYLVLISVTIKHTLHSKSELRIPIFSGYISLLVTQFFGFNVVVTSLLMFMLPLYIFAHPKNYKESFTTIQSIVISLFVAGIGLSALFSYIKADISYNTAHELKTQGNYNQAILAIKQAHIYNRYESLYLNEQADIEASLAVIQFENSNEDAAKRLANYALGSSQEALQQSPHNHLYLKKRASILIRMAGIDPAYIKEAYDILEILTKLLPNDPEIHFNYALLQVRTGQPEDAFKTLDKTIVLKPNYKNPRLLRAELLVKAELFKEAQKELEYIRNYIDPYDEEVNKLYETIK